jgi:DNA-binding NarL/FixJ family response regulator
MPGALLIDDHEALLASVKAAAEAKGLTLHTASTWDGGLALFHVHSPDLVIADYNLPGSPHGLQLLEEVRRLRPSVRLVLLSGVVGTDELEEVERLKGAHKVLTKGSASETIRSIIDEIEAASASVEERTDWRAFARAWVDAQEIPSDDLRLLDETIRESLGDG